MGEIDPAVPARDGADAIAISPGRLASVFLWVVAALLVAGIVRMIAVNTYDADPMHTVLRWINLNGDPSIPAWFTSLMLFVASAAAATCRHADQGRLRAYWIALSIGLLYLSADEAAQIHEFLGGLLLPPDMKFSGPLLYNWVVVALPLVALAIAFLAPFVARLPAGTRWRLALAGAVYLAGAFGFEMLGASTRSTWTSDRPSDLANLYIVLEEAGEMVGVVLLLRALSHHLTVSRSSPIDWAPADRLVGQ